MLSLANPGGKKWGCGDMPPKRSVRPAPEGAMKGRSPYPPLKPMGWPIDPIGEKPYPPPRISLMSLNLGVLRAMAGWP